MLSSLQMQEKDLIDNSSGSSDIHLCFYQIWRVLEGIGGQIPGLTKTSCKQTSKDPIVNEFDAC